MITANLLRFDLTLTPLNDGTVLSAGGRSSTFTVRRSSQILDVDVDDITDSGLMTVPRANHVAAKLNDGRVFVAGGEGNSGGPGVGSDYTAEVCNPTTGMWTAVPPMDDSRSRPTAALLADGRVLVVGGNTAEVYDPTTNAWSATSPLRTGTGGLNHAMTTLADGRVMSVGGSASTDGRPDVEVFDPATNAWTPAASMNEGRSFHTATTLSDGSVLLRSRDSLRSLVIGGPFGAVLASPLVGTSWWS